MFFAVSRGVGSGTSKHEHYRGRKTICGGYVEGREDHWVEKEGLHTEDLDYDECSIWFGEVQTLDGTSSKLLVRVLSKNKEQIVLSYE